MKLKKTLSGVLAAAMVVSLTPAMAFATTSNTVKAVPTVAEDTAMPRVDISLEAKDTTYWTNTGEAGGTAVDQTIKMTFENAEWDTNPTIGSAIGTSAVPGTEAVFNYVLVENLSDGKSASIDVAEGSVVASGGEKTIDEAGAALAGLTYADYAASYDADTNTLTLTANDVGVKTAPVLTYGDSTVPADNATAGTDPVAAVPPETDIASMLTMTNGTIKKVLSVSDNSVEFTFTPNATNAKETYTFSFIAGKLKSGVEDGPVTIAIDGLDSYVTSSTLTIANVGSNTTVATVNGDAKTFGRKTIASGDIKTSIEIRESSVNSLVVGDVQKLELRLPKGVSWNKAGTSIVGSLASSYDLSAEGRYLYVTFTVGGTNSTRDVMTIMPSITIGKDATQGDIAVSIIGKSSSLDKDVVSDADDLVIAVYGDEKVTVSTLENVPTVYAGYKQDKNDKDFKLYVTLKENMAGALTNGKFVDFDLPEEIQIRGTIKASKDTGDKGTFSPVPNTLLTIGKDDLKNGTAEADLMKQDSSAFTFEIPDATGTESYGPASWSNAKGNTVTFEIPVTAKANFTGDVTVNVSGSKAGIDETDLVIGTVESPITVEAATTEVKNGVQKQAVANITITEKLTGYIDDKTDITLTLDDLGLTNSLVFDDAEAKVTAGDMEIGKVDTTQGIITIPVKNASTKVSTIEVSAITATLNRTLPEGGYDLKVGGDALVENSEYDDKDFTGTAVKVKDYLKIVTPAESVTVSEKVDAKFVIGEASYTNNGAATEMDAAAYIDSHNRTMVPIRYVANACGISENDIRWEAGSQTAIINGLNTVVTVKMGSNKLQTSTGEITMDTVAVNNNGRIYVPVRYIANALGANVSWDAATKTVTLTK